MNNILHEASRWLTDVGIATEFQGNCLAVKRTDVDSVIGGGPNEAALTLINELKSAVSKKLYWGGVSANDTWLYLESF